MGSNDDRGGISSSYGMSCRCDLVHNQGGLSCMNGNSVEDVCSESTGALSTGVNSISVKKWCTFPKKIKIVNKNCKNCVVAVARY